MAQFAENGTGTWTERGHIPNAATNPLPDQSREEEATPAPTDDRTATFVNVRERGDRKVKDQYEASIEMRPETSTATLAATQRRDVAASLSKAIARILDSHGSVKMAADLALLKRELSKAHDLLRLLPTESNFLSLIVLVESALGIKPWREISQQEMAALQSAIDIGVNEPRVTFDEYNRTLRTLNALGWSTGPTLDFADVAYAPEQEQEPADR